jgi:hypothetical protein
MERLSRWFERSDWNDAFGGHLARHIGEPCDKFDLTVEELASELGAQPFATVVDCAFEDFLTGEHGPQGRNPVEEYLARRGRLESPQGRMYLSALRRSVMSVYEVREVTPGSHIVVQDLVRGGESLAVREVRGSQQLVKWDRLACRVLSVGASNCLSGGVLLLRQEPADEFLAMIGRVIARTRRQLYKARRRPAPEGPLQSLKSVSGEEAAQLSGELETFALSRSAYVLTTLWLNEVLESRRRPAPPLFNSDGEALVLAEVRFPLLCGDRDELRRRFERATEMLPDDAEGSRWSWVREQPGGRREPVQPNGANGLVVDAFRCGDRSRVALAGVEIDDAQVVLSANSAERAQRGKALIEELLEGLVGAGSIACVPVEQALKDREGDPSPRDGAALPAEQEAQVMKNFMDAHYREWITMPLPALGGRTPRQAARSRAGRRQLCALLKTMENNDLRAERATGRPPYDAGWLWEALGIAELR